MQFNIFDLSIPPCAIKVVVYFVVNNYANYVEDGREVTHHYQTLQSYSCKILTGNISKMLYSQMSTYCNIPKENLDILLYSRLQGISVSI